MCSLHLNHKGGKPAKYALCRFFLARLGRDHKFDRKGFWGQSMLQKKKTHHIAPMNTMRSLLHFFSIVCTFPYLINLRQISPTTNRNSCKPNTRRIIFIYHISGIRCNFPFIGTIQYWIYILRIRRTRPKQKKNAIKTCSIQLRLMI